MRLELPFPPSVNNYWRYTSMSKRKGQHIISQAGLKFKSLAIKNIIEQLKRKPVPFQNDVDVVITFHKPDARKRDLDNFLKALFDVLTQIGIWKDDSQVAKMTVQWGDVIKGGKTVIEITERNY